MDRDEKKQERHACLNSATSAISILGLRRAPEGSLKVSLSPEKDSTGGSRGESGVGDKEVGVWPRENPPEEARLSGT